MELLFNVANSILARVDTAKIVGRNITKAKFSFDDTWNDIAKVAVFSRGSTGYPVMLSDDGTCDIPDEILEHSGYCRVEIDGANGAATNFITLYVYPNLQASTGLEDVAEKNLLQQVIDLINDLKHTVIDETLISQCVASYIQTHPDEITDPEEVVQIVTDYVDEHKEELRGFTGETGQTGKAGTNGLSAYEIAKKHGYYGSEELWLQSLKGERGETGLAGKDAHTPVKGTDYWTSSEVNEMMTEAVQLVKEYITEHREDFRGPAGANGVGLAGTDGKTPVRGEDYFTAEDMAYFNEQITALVVNYWNKHQLELQGRDGAPGVNGTDGVGISDVQFNDDYELVITLTNGKKYTSSSLKGKDGNVDEIDMSAYILKEELQTELVDYAKKSELPTMPDLSEYAKKSEIPSESGDSVLDKDLTTAVAVGGIAEGKTYKAGTTVQTILNELLNPTLYPTFTSASAGISASGTKLFESGSSQKVTMTITFNRGAIVPAYGTNGKRVGNATAYTLNGAAQSNGTFSVIVNENNTSFKGTVTYSAGEQPKDSKGNDYWSAAPAGSVDTNTINYEFVDALYANTSKIDAVSKLALVSKQTKSKQFNFPAQTVANPEEFHVPTSWEITAIQVLNTLSGKWENCASEFKRSTTQHPNAAGEKVNYYTYKDNRGYNAGARSIKITWK